MLYGNTFIPGECCILLFQYFTLEGQLNYHNIKSIMNRPPQATILWINPSANMLSNITGMQAFIVKCPLPSCALSYNSQLGGYLTFTDSRPHVAELLACCPLSTIYYISLVKPVFNTGPLPSYPDRGHNIVSDWLHDALFLNPCCHP